MSGFEKVCEFSGEYCGLDMYDYKHNLIQIMPKFRKQFKGVHHTFFVFIPYHFMFESPIYHYCLCVEDPELQGNCEGCYFNYTFDFGTTRRKIQRLLGYTRLTRFNIPLTVNEFFSYARKEKIADRDLLDMCVFFSKDKWDSIGRY